MRKVNVSTVDQASILKEINVYLVIVLVHFVMKKHVLSVRLVCSGQRVQNVEDA